MTPITQEIQEFNKYRTQLLNFNKKLTDIKNINDLVDFRDVYINWILDLRDFINRIGYKEKISSIYSKDKVLSHRGEGGAGIILGDERSTLLINLLENEIRNKILLLDGIYSQFFNINRAIEKNGNNFSYYFKPIILGMDSMHYHLLDILYYHTNSDGFISYKKIIDLFEKRKKAKLISSKKVTKVTVTNAKTELFNRAKFSDNTRLPNITKSGAKLISADSKRKGYIFNNEEIK